MPYGPPLPYQWSTHEEHRRAQAQARTHLGLDVAPLTYQFWPTKFLDPESEVLGAYIPGEPHVHEAAHDPSPHELPYKTLTWLHSLMRDSDDPQDQDYAAELLHEITERGRLRTRYRHEFPERDERLVAACTSLLRQAEAVLELNEVAPHFAPLTAEDVAEFARRRRVMETDDPFDFTGSPETQYHHRQTSWPGEDDYDIDAMYERLHRRLPIHSSSPASPA